MLRQGPARDLTRLDIVVGSSTVVGRVDLAEMVAAQHGVTVEDMLSPRRSAGLVLARNHLYQALRDLGWSYSEIGRYCRRDHTTVMYACKQPSRRWAVTNRQAAPVLAKVLPKQHKGGRPVGVDYTRTATGELVRVPA